MKRYLIILSYTTLLVGCVTNKKLLFNDYKTLDIYLKE